MSLQARIVASGLSAINAQAIQGTVAVGLTAAGTVQANALPLGADVNQFTTVGAGTGAILPAMNPGDEIVLTIAGVANALLLYPPVGGKINALGVNAGYSIAVATPTVFVICISPTQYSCSQSA